MMYLQKVIIFLLVAVLCVPNEESKQEPNKCIFKFWKKIFHKISYNCIHFFTSNMLTLQEAGGLQKPSPEEKLHFLEPFCDPINPKKFDFSLISMTMPPILFWGLKMA